MKTFLALLLLLHLVGCAYAPLVTDFPDLYRCELNGYEWDTDTDTCTDPVCDDEFCEVEID